jgi:hypothetical protein
VTSIKWSSFKIRRDHSWPKHRLFWRSCEVLLSRSGLNRSQYLKESNNPSSHSPTNSHSSPTIRHYIYWATKTPSRIIYIYIYIYICVCVCVCVYIYRLNNPVVVSCVLSVHQSIYNKHQFRLPEFQRYTEDGINKILRNTNKHILDYTASHTSVAYFRITAFLKLNIRTTAGF